MKKLTLLAFVIVAGFAASCGDDSPLKECVVCTHPDVLTPYEECGGKVSMETVKATYEGMGYSCHNK